MGFSKFINNPDNSRTRERIYFHKLAFDLDVAAARKDYHLQMFEPEVDRDGFDVVLSDGDYERHIQVKTVSSTTNQWSIGKRLLRPSARVTDALGRDPDMYGLNGGFLLMKIDETEGEKVDYFYADFYTILAFSEGLFGCERNAATNTLDELFIGCAGEEIFIRKRVLLKAGNPSAVLGLMGLLNILEKQLMPHTFIEYLKAPQIPPTGGLSNPPKDALGQLISSTIADLI